jgi:UDPglucose 6-dehydrogenase
MKQIAVIGVGYVGLVTAACFSDLGNKVFALDIDENKVAALKNGEIPIYEPGLEELVKRNIDLNRVNFTTSMEEALKDSEFVFICVGTPTGNNGDTDMQYVDAVARSIGENMKAPLIVVNKSTVPVGTGDRVTEKIIESQPEPIDFSVVSCPEFLREGSAINDFMNPYRTICGSKDQIAAEKVADLYKLLNAPTLITDIRSAEMIKYASNAFLATKISFINEIANFCEELGADVTEVARGMGMDDRIGPLFLGAGLGYGGSCFPKDIKALNSMAKELNVDSHILKAVMDTNEDRRTKIVDRLQEVIKDLNGKTIAILGLSFKPKTDDMRDAPSIEIINNLLSQGTKVKAYDPVAMDEAKKHLPNVQLMPDPYQAADGADALLVITEWPEFSNIDLERIQKIMRSPIVIDGRNIYEPEDMKKLGFTYSGIGRGYKKNDK